ncbi:MAG: hypothetical protein ACTS22_07300 [Phycisphaerales bacterium]
MRVHRFWSIARGSAQGPDGVTEHRTVWRGSDASQADADALARRAIDEAQRVIRSGDHRAHWYAYERSSRPEPIVQEFVDDEGHRYAAVTVNRWGASVLNTAWLPIVDVDLPQGTEQAGPLKRLLLGWLLEQQDAVRLAGRLLVLGKWLGEDAQRGARVYRTKAGVRYILPVSRMDPASEATGAMMQQLKADGLYARLCRAQRSFRARLSPKPWRIGMAGGPPVRVDTVDGASAGAWLAEYERRSEGFAVCELLETRGPESDDPRVRELIELHDAATGATSGRPLA